jgi:hypothetical protein
MNANAKAALVLSLILGISSVASAAPSTALAGHQPSTQAAASIHEPSKAPHIAAFDSLDGEPVSDTEAARIQGAGFFKWIRRVVGGTLKKIDRINVTIRY